MDDDNINDVKKVFISYTLFGEYMNQLVEKIEPFKSNYSCIHGLPRGGLSIAVHLSHYLELPLMMNVAQFTTEFPNGKLLVVDDIIDTGRTFERFLEIARVKRIKFETAVLFYKPHSIYSPNYYIKETSDWIVFPWEPIEEKPNRDMYLHLGGSIETMDSDLDQD